MAAIRVLVFLFLSLTLVAGVSPPGWDEAVGGDLQVYYGNAVKPVAVKDNTCAPYESKTATSVISRGLMGCFFYSDMTCTNRQMRSKKPFFVENKKVALTAPADISAKAFKCQFVAFGPD